VLKIVAIAQMYAYKRTIVVGAVEPVEVKGAFLLAARVTWHP
jgi:hypothetical protein